ncbi:MAG: Hint domain-containing protein [Bdellovibrionales bacterium]
MRYLLSLALILSSISATSATTDGEKRFDQISLTVAQVEVDGHVLPDFHQFSTAIMTKEKLAGREFTHEELVQLASEEIRLSGLRRCFTGPMRVLTPTGYVPIDMLKMGDEVLSLDLKSEKQITNRIQNVNVSLNTEYGELCDLAPEGRKIQTTGSHPFYSVDALDYEELRLILPNSLLLQIRDCEMALVKRGMFKFPVGQAAVYSFTLELNPQNFIVEGILVHNKPIF